MGKNLIFCESCINFNNGTMVLSFRQSNVDAAIRTVAIVQILKGLQANTNNSAEFLRLVLAKLSVFGAKRYYADSQLHRLKQRLMQILLILQPALDRVRHFFHF